MFGDKLQTWKSGSHFMFAFLALPKEQRRALYAVYAFSRGVDDVADGEGSDREKEGHLAEWRSKLEAAYQGGRGEPLTQELAWAVDRFQIPKSYFEDLMKGVALDLSQTRYPTFADLERYCYYVAGAIGLICNAIFGEDSDEARAYAVTLGTAFQLTNIIRDVRRDLSRGRIYIPEEDLRRFRVSAEALADGSPSCERLLDFEAERARRYFCKARSILSRKGWGPMLAAEIMAGIYYGLLLKVQRGRFRHREPVRLSRLARARIALGIWAEAKTRGLIPRAFLGVRSP